MNTSLSRSERVIILVLLLFLGLQLMAPAFAPGVNDATLPACCRVGSKHHCMMTGMKNPQDRGVTTIADKCPYCPLTRMRIVLPDFAPTGARAIFASVNAHPSPDPQTAARFRISFDRTRQKRGPPFSHPKNT